ncbi:hypothetical protein LguiA_012956 [Lonicera macranthoides]
MCPKSNHFKQGYEVHCVVPIPILSRRVKHNLEDPHTSGNMKEEQSQLGAKY